MKLITILMMVPIVSLLASCDVKKEEPYEKEGITWDRTDLNDEDIEHYAYKDENDDMVYLYSQNAIKDIDFGEKRLPTTDELLELIESFTYVETFISELQVKPNGMYDFTNIYQWVGEKALFLTKEGAGYKVVMIDFETMEVTTGNFHLDDYVSIRLVKK